MSVLLRPDFPNPAAIESSPGCGGTGPSAPGPGDGPSHPSHRRDACPGAAASSSRTDRYLARVDAHLLTLADDAARRAFLTQQLKGWERRYARFVETEGRSEPRASGPYADPSTPPDAADFLLTITGLAARREAIAEATS